MYKQKKISKIDRENADFFLYASYMKILTVANNTFCIPTRLSSQMTKVNKISQTTLMKSAIALFN